MGLTEQLHIERTVPDAHVDRAEALRYIGYAGQQIDDALSARFDRVIAHCEQVASPSYAYRIMPLEHTDEGMHLVGSALTLSGNDIARHLDGASACGVLVCTLGLSYERELQQLNRRNELDGLLFGTAGSSLVESVADICETTIVAKAAAAGLRTNTRFSPGYGDLPLTLQPLILDVLDAPRRLGVIANDSNLLIPTKSTTAFIGLFDSDHLVSSVKQSCAQCPCKSHCTLRKQGTPCYR